MFGLFFHPGRSHDGPPVAMRIVPGQQAGETTNAPPPFYPPQEKASLPQACVHAAAAAIDDEAGSEVS